ncbi:hypothetical protein BCR34DRAFT_650777, partial [Clohesyomyces aquaticus]
GGESAHENAERRGKGRWGETSVEGSNCGRGTAAALWQSRVQDDDSRQARKAGRRWLVAQSEPEPPPCAGRSRRSTAGPAYQAAAAAAAGRPGQAVWLAKFIRGHRANVIIAGRSSAVSHMSVGRASEHSSAPWTGNSSCAACGLLRTPCNAAMALAAASPARHRPFPLTCSRLSVSISPRGQYSPQPRYQCKPAASSFFVLCFLLVDRYAQRTLPQSIRLTILRGEAAAADNLVLHAAGSPHRRIWELHGAWPWKSGPSNLMAASALAVAKRLS